MTKLKLGADVAALNPGVTDARLPGASKYGNQKAERDGITFDSQAEAARYDELCLLQRAGVISGLVLQENFVLYVNGVKICTYIADFSYWQNGRWIVEDCKGFRTPAYRIKAKLMQALRDITILETGGTR